jgi:hypothetical protein
MMAKFINVYYAAAAATAIAGMLHLMLGPSILRFSVYSGVLFIVGGLAQIFWIMPTIRRWGRGWYAIGLAGTAVFMALFLITRMPGNPITGQGEEVDPISIAVEEFQALFIGLTLAIIMHDYKRRKRVMEPTGINGVGEDVLGKTSGKKQIGVLAGVAVALALVGLFLLPMIMPEPMG